MITLALVAVILGVVLILASTIGVVLLEPVIAILAIYGIYKLVTLCMGKPKKKKRR